MSILKRWRIALVAALVTLSVLGGTASYAYWSAAGQANMTVNAATLADTATGWAASTMGNETISTAGSNSLVSTGFITITNTTSTTSSSSQTLTATFSRASGNATFAAGTALTVWSAASTAACSTGPTGTTYTGNWNTGVVATATLAPNASIVYCMRNVVSDRQSAADASGTASFTPQVAAILSIGGFSGGTTATSTISAQYIYPLASINSTVWYNIIRAGTNWCLDGSGAGNTSGTLLISYGCKNNTDLNQDFKFADADGDTYLDIAYRTNTGLRIAAAASTASGSAIDLRTAAATTGVQEWQMQSLGSGVYQFVNQNSGLCMSAPAASTAVVTQVTCNNGADQRFTLSPRLALTSFACSNVGGTDANGSVRYDWVNDYTTGTLTVQAKRTSVTTWTTIGTTATNGFAFPVPIGANFTTTGGYDVQVINSSGTVVATDSLTVSNTFFGMGSNYARC